MKADLIPKEVDAATAAYVFLGLAHAVEWIMSVHWSSFSDLDKDLLRNLGRKFGEEANVFLQEAERRAAESIDNNPSVE